MEPITFEEVLVLDANSEYRGVPTLTLMENAGRGVAEHLLDLGAKGKRVLIMCGSGNNGGDGLVAARYLSGKAAVDVVLVRPRGQIRTVISRHNLQRAEEADVPVHDMDKTTAELLRRADLVVDAMLGVGMEGTPRGPYAEAIKAVNASGKRVVAVDVPTGWGTELAIRPESTVTFYAPKVGMGAECGRIVVNPIGVPQEAMDYAGPGELTLVPRVAKDAHKGQRGTVLVVGGGPYHGAPTLCALSAHRAGVDLVFVAVPGAIAEVVRGFSLDLIVQPVGDSATELFAPRHLEAVREHEGRADAVVLGPGIGQDPGTLEFAVRAYAAYAAAGKPVVVDADALRALGAQGAIPRNPRAVLTPHSGEFASLGGAPLPPPGEERGRVVAVLAAKLGCTIIAKGPVDVISDGHRMKLNDSGNAAMATGGTGDILAGVTGAFLAKGMDPFDASRAAAFTVGAAGDAALSRVGHSMLATDVLAELPGVLARYVPWWTKR